MVEEIWQKVFAKWEASPSIHRGTFTEIELLKLSVNCVLATKISLANSLGQLFKLYDVDPAVVQVLGQDPRLGVGFWKPGSPISGPCLPRDNKALRTAAYAKSLTLPLSEATDDVDFAVRMGMLSVVMSHSPRVVGILGLSYKHGLDVTDGSMGSWLKEKLEESEVGVIWHDEHVRGTQYSPSTLESVLKCDVIVVCHEELEHLTDAVLDRRKVVKVWS
jgi:GDP-mannose 6-dehydrogenase